jgi:hypothetical protein
LGSAEDVVPVVVVVEAVEAAAVEMDLRPGDCRPAVTDVDSRVLASMRAAGLTVRTPWIPRIA